VGKNEVSKKIPTSLPRVSWEHWGFEFYEDSPNEFDFERAWAEHRDLHTSRIPTLDRRAVKDLAIWMGRGNAPGELVELVAENLPCEYMENLEDGRIAPRDSELLKEAEAIRIAAIGLERALVSASGTTRGAVSVGFFPVAREKMGLPRLLDEMKACHQFFVDGARPFDIDTQANPELIEGLKALAKGAEFVIGRTPKDRGGASSGSHDSNGRRAKERLVITARNTLKNLGLPCGAHKGGAVSKFVALVHRAATGEEAPWADKFAAMAPTLEKKG